MIRIDQLENTVFKQNKQWLDSLNTEMRKTIINDTAKQTVNYLKKNSPKDTGGYAKTWKYEKNGHIQGVYKYATTVYNEKNYRLTHLLEYGHQKRGGGRTKAQPHIIDAEKLAEDILIENIIDAVARTI